MGKLSSQFLLPLVGATGRTLFVPQFKGSYMAASEHPCQFGRCLFLQYSADVPSSTSDTFKSLPTYQETVSTSSDGDLLFVFKVEDKDYEGVVKPFVDGKYSAVDRGYVDKFFPRNPNSATWWNRLILDKDSRVVSYWQSRGVNLPKGAEVWNKVKKDDETYGYTDEVNERVDLVTGSHNGDQ